MDLKIGLLLRNLSSSDRNTSSYRVIISLIEKACTNSGTIKNKFRYGYPEAEPVAHFRCIKTDTQKLIQRALVYRETVIDVINSGGGHIKGM